VTTPAAEPLPDDVETLKAMFLAQREALASAEARAMAAETNARDQALLIEKLEHQIARLRHERFGQSSERRALLDQLELQLFELKEDKAEVEAATQADEAPTQAVQAFTRRKPARRPLPGHLPRERVVYPMPTACPCCGGVLHKLGEDVTETLELVPRQWKVIQHVREKHSCRSCEKITQPPAPSHPIARGRAGPGLLAHVLFATYGLHLPLTRQSVTYAREGIELDVSTLADWVGASAATLMPLVEAVRAHVFAAERLHADDTTVPVLDVGRTRTARLWTYVRDDRPFSGADPPAAAYFYSPDRSGEHPEAHARVMGRADAGRRLCRLRPAGTNRPRLGRSSKRRAGPCAAQVLRPGALSRGTDRHRGGRPHRYPVRHRATSTAAAQERAGRTNAAGRVSGARRLAARTARQACRTARSPRRSPTASTPGTR
jgi:transposase